MAKTEYPHAGHRQRLRERFLTNGADALSETELLELLLFFSVPRIDTRPLAEALLEAYGSLDGVLAAEPEELHAFAWLTSATDAHFQLIRYLRERAERSMQQGYFGTPEFLIKYLPRQFSGFRKERAVLFYLDGDGSLLRRQTVLSSAEGAVKLTMNSYAETAKRIGASAVILAHNHPNGRAFPSGADLDATGRLHQTLQKRDITLLEHYIVAGTECYPILANYAQLRTEPALETDANSDRVELH